jgi:hypothetical protein
VRIKITLQIKFLYPQLCILKQPCSKTTCTRFLIQMKQYMKISNANPCVMSYDLYCLGSIHAIFTNHWKISRMYVSSFWKLFLVMTLQLRSCIITGNKNMTKMFQSVKSAAIKWFNLTYYVNKRKMSWLHHHNNARLLKLCKKLPKWVLKHYPIYSTSMIWYHVIYI